MRKVILSLHMSLDGFISGPNGALDWATFDREADGLLPPLLARSDTALLGREMYQQFYGYWPAKKEPFFSSGEQEFAGWINRVPKVVFSRTLDAVEWNGTVVKEDVPGAIARLKDQPGKDMLIVGGVRLPRSLAQLGLIDEYHLLVSPVILGGGERLFATVEDRARLKLLHARSFAVGAVSLAYETQRG